MRCFVVFGVTLRLFVINISSSSPAINTAAYYQRCVITCETVAVVHRRPRLQYLAYCSVNTGSQPDIGSDFCLPHLHSTPPLGGFPSEYCYAVWHRKTRMVWLPDGEEILMICFIRFDTTHERDRRQTDRRTDTAWRYRPRLHSIARQKSRFSTNISFCFRIDAR